MGWNYTFPYKDHQLFLYSHCHSNGESHFSFFSEVPFTLIIPKDIDVNEDDTEKVKEFLFEHIIPGAKTHGVNWYGNLNGNKVTFDYTCADELIVQRINQKEDILRTDSIDDNMQIIYIESNLLEKDSNRFNKRNIQENNRYVEWTVVIGFEASKYIKCISLSWS